MIRDDGQIIYRADVKQRIKERCMCCRKYGYDYEVRDGVKDEKQMDKHKQTNANGR